MEYFFVDSCLEKQGLSLIQMDIVSCTHPIAAPCIRVILSIAFAAAVWGCSGNQVENHMRQHDPIAGCPRRPNCVSSESQDPKRTVAPMHIAGDAAAVWAAIQQVVRRLPRSTIVKSTDRYVHATLKSSLFGFVDDLELKLDPQTKTIHIRSASRNGYFDLGVNRRRVEYLRKQLKAADLIR